MQIYTNKYKWVKCRSYLCINTIECGIWHELIDLRNPDIVILVDDALGFYSECFQSGIRPPGDGIAVLVILTALVVETVSDLVPNHLW